MAERLSKLLRHLKQPSYVVGCESSLEASSVSPPTSQFRFTLDNCKLNLEQRQFYEKNGYIVIKNLVSPQSIETYVNRFVEITDGDEPVPGLIKMKDVAIVKKTSKDGEKTITKLQDFQNDPTLFGFCELPQILDYVEGFVGSDISAMHTMLINKPPDPGTKSSRHPMHQDLYYFPFRPADRVVCAWTALQHVHRGNGCLVAVPGSHYGELQQHNYPQWEGGVNKMYHGVKNFAEDMPRVYLEMGPGDTVFFHPLLLHGSGRNLTQGFRKAISCHYAASNCKYIDVRGTVQESIAEEVNDLARRRLGDGIEFDYAMIWMLKGRPVRGEPGSLQG